MTSTMYHYTQWGNVEEVGDRCEKSCVLAVLVFVEASECYFRVLMVRFGMYLHLKN